MSGIRWVVWTERVAGHVVAPDKRTAIVEAEHRYGHGVRVQSVASYEVSQEELAGRRWAPGTGRLLPTDPIPAED